MDPENRIKTPLLFFSWVYMDTFIDSRRSSSSPKGVQFCNCSPPILPFPTAVGRFTDGRWWVSPFFVFDQEQKDQLKPPENKPHHPSEGGILMFYHRTGAEMVFAIY